MQEVLSPLDGRYQNKVSALLPFFGDAALAKYRLFVETEYLMALSLESESGVRKFTGEEISLLRDLPKRPGLAEKVLQIELEGNSGRPATQHDVKAVEYFLKDQLAASSLADVSEWVHFALTSEDVNSVAYGLMLQGALREVLIPTLEELLRALTNLAMTNKDSVMLARTHGQPASPTTFGKEIRVFIARLERQVVQLRHQNILVKFGGATGNWNAHFAAYPNIDWPSFSQRFIEDLNIGQELRVVHSAPTTQIEPHDNLAETFDNLRRINTICIDFNQDMWRYVSDGYVVQKTIAGEVGSSTMPHKVNPIKFENSEGNLGLANALFEFFSRKLPVSRLQRDLSDSTVLRNIGVALGHSLLGYVYILDGLRRVAVNSECMKEEVRRHPEVLAEAIQTILRREGVADAYEVMKDLTRGGEVSLEKIQEFVRNLEVGDKVKTELLELRPEKYIGLASDL